MLQHGLLKKLSYPKGNIIIRLVEDEVPLDLPNAHIPREEYDELIPVIQDEQGNIIPAFENAPVFNDERPPEEFSVPEEVNCPFAQSDFPHYPPEEEFEVIPLEESPVDDGNFILLEEEEVIPEDAISEDIAFEEPIIEEVNLDEGLDLSTIPELAEYPETIKALEEILADENIPSNIEIVIEENVEDPEEKELLTLEDMENAGAGEETEITIEDQPDAFVDTILKYLDVDENKLKNQLFKGKDLEEINLIREKFQTKLDNLNEESGNPDEIQFIQKVLNLIDEKISQELGEDQTTEEAPALETAPTLPEAPTTEPATPEVVGEEIVTPTPELSAAPLPVEITNPETETIPVIEETAPLEPALANVPEATEVAPGDESVLSLAPEEETLPVLESAPVEQTQPLVSEPTDVLSAPEVTPDLNSAPALATEVPQEPLNILPEETEEEVVIDTTPAEEQLLKEMIQERILEGGEASLSDIDFIKRVKNVVGTDIPDEEIQQLIAQIADEVNLSSDVPIDITAEDTAIETPNLIPEQEATTTPPQEEVLQLEEAQPEIPDLTSTQAPTVSPQETLQLAEEEPVIPVLDNAEINALEQNIESLPEEIQVEDLQPQTPPAELSNTDDLSKEYQSRLEDLYQFREFLLNKLVADPNNQEAQSALDQIETEIKQLEEVLGLPPQETLPNLVEQEVQEDIQLQNPVDTTTTPAPNLSNNNLYVREPELTTVTNAGAGFSPYFDPKKVKATKSLKREYAGAGNLKNAGGIGTILQPVWNATKSVLPWLAAGTAATAGAVTGAQSVSNYSDSGRNSSKNLTGDVLSNLENDNSVIGKNWSTGEGLDVVKQAVEKQHKGWNAFLTDPVIPFIGDQGKYSEKQIANQITADMQQLYRENITPNMTTDQVKAAQNSIMQLLKKKYGGTDYASATVTSPQAAIAGVVPSSGSTLQQLQQQVVGGTNGSYQEVVPVDWGLSSYDRINEDPAEVLLRNGYTQPQIDQLLKEGRLSQVATQVDSAEKRWKNRYNQIATQMAKGKEIYEENIVNGAANAANKSFDPENNPVDRALVEAGYNPETLRNMTEAELMQVRSAIGDNQSRKQVAQTGAAVRARAIANSAQRNEREILGAGVNDATANPSGRQAASLINDSMGAQIADSAGQFASDVAQADIDTRNVFNQMAQVYQQRLQAIDQGRYAASINDQELLNSAGLTQDYIDNVTQGNDAQRRQLQNELNALASMWNDVANGLPAGATPEQIALNEAQQRYILNQMAQYQFQLGLRKSPILSATQ